MLPINKFISTIYSYIYVWSNAPENTGPRKLTIDMLLDV